MIRNAKKVARELQGPGLFEITLGAVLSLTLGACLAAAYLISLPVETVKSLPKEPDPHKVYYVQGNARNALGRQWLRKKQMLVEGGTVEIQLNEDELNTWMSSSKAKPDAEAEAGIFTTREINFHLKDGALQIGLPCSFALAGVTRDVVVQASGGFAREGDRYVYKPKSLMVGTLPVHRLPVVGDWVTRQLLATHEVPEDLLTAWKSLSAVSVEGDALKLVRR